MALIRRRSSAPQREPRSEDFEVLDDPWLVVPDEGALPDGDVLVSLARFERERDALTARVGRLGVRVPGDAKREAIEAIVGPVALIAVELPTARDGRAYSVARCLRTQLGFVGELRATGKVVRDQLGYLARVGFDAFELSRGSASDALAAFDELTVQYQASSDQPLPLWRRVARA